MDETQTKWMFGREAPYGGNSHTRIVEYKDAAVATNCFRAMLRAGGEARVTVKYPETDAEREGLGRRPPSQV
jgi:hypothetical protein